MKKIFALLVATVVIASASFAQTGTDTSMHHSMHHKTMKTKTMKGDSTMKMKTKKPA